MQTRYTKILGFLMLLSSVFTFSFLSGCVVSQTDNSTFVGSARTDSAAIREILSANQLDWEEDLDIIWYEGRVKLLSIRDRNMTRIPDAIGRLSHLEEIDLQGNKIRTISSEIGRLPLLEELNLRDNSLDSLPSTIGNLAVLEELDLTRNRLRSIPTTLQQLVSLEDLFLEDNFLTCPLPSFLENKAAVRSWAPKIRILNIDTCL